MRGKGNRTSSCVGRFGGLAGRYAIASGATNVLALYQARCNALVRAGDLPATTKCSFTRDVPGPTRASDTRSVCVQATWSTLALLRLRGARDVYPVPSSSSHVSSSGSLHMLHSRDPRDAHSGLSSVDADRRTFVHNALQRKGCASHPVPLHAWPLLAGSGADRGCAQRALH